MIIAALRRNPSARSGPGCAAKLRRLRFKHPPRCSQSAQGALLAVSGQLYQLGRGAHGAGKVLEKMVGAGNKGLGIHAQAGGPTAAEI